ncbi:hypothetical protein CRG98_021655 [Punica granatum]|uniref:Uncharacterized protein n=1 Tax=Punica granatum TaxID=22663 RepID=A0A2I0JPW7_PUNGR|nr:hypothetical protein CRG98_021655 [Punica granatum]
MHCLKKERLQEARAPAWRVAGCTGACPADLQYVRAHCPMDCEVHGRLPGGFAICTGALPCGLRGVRALARRICNMRGRIALWIVGCTSAYPTGLQYARAHT